MEVLKLVVYFSCFAQGFCIRLYGFCITVGVPKQHLYAVLAIEVNVRSRGSSDSSFRN